MTASTAPVPETMEGLMRQNSALRTLNASLEDEIKIHRAKAQEYHLAIASLDSERAANARLTLELEEAKAQFDAHVVWASDQAGGAS